MNTQSNEKKCVVARILESKVVADVGLKLDLEDANTLIKYMHSQQILINSQQNLIATLKETLNNLDHEHKTSREDRDHSESAKRV